MWGTKILYSTCSYNAVESNHYNEYIYNEQQKFVPLVKSFKPQVNSQINARHDQKHCVCLQRTASLSVMFKYPSSSNYL